MPHPTPFFILRPLIWHPENLYPRFLSLITLLVLNHSPRAAGETPTQHEEGHIGYSRKSASLKQAAALRTTCLGAGADLSIIFQLLSGCRMRYLTSRAIDTLFMFSHGAVYYMVTESIVEAPDLENLVSCTLQQFNFHK